MELVMQARISRVHGFGFNQKNKWNQDVKSNLENFEFSVGPISKFALVRMIVHQFKNLKLKICMVFTQEFEFCFQIFILLVLRNLFFETSEAPLSSIWKNWQKSLFFHEYLPKGLTNFGRSESKLYTLNYTQLGLIRNASRRND